MKCRFYSYTSNGIFMECPNEKMVFVGDMKDEINKYLNEKFLTAKQERKDMMEE